MKEVREFAGAHVLSMMCAHYPLIDFTRFMKGYPKEVGVLEMGELQGQLSKLAAMIIGDMRNINATIARNVDNVCSEVFEPTTWDYGLDQPIPG
jgi:hypothetical protein